MQAGETAEAEHHRGADFSSGPNTCRADCLEQKVPDCLLWKANKRVYESLCGRDQRALPYCIRADRPSSLPAERLESQVSSSYSLEWWLNGIRSLAFKRLKILITTSAAQFNREGAGITQQWYQSPLYLFFRFLDMWFLRYMHDYCVNYVCIESLGFLIICSWFLVSWIDSWFLDACDRILETLGMRYEWIDVGFELYIRGAVRNLWGK